MNMDQNEEMNLQADDEDLQPMDQYEENEENDVH